VGRPLITLDTSGLYALLDRRDRDHEAARAVLEQDNGPFVVPVGILAEIAYLAESRLGLETLDVLLDDLATGAYSLDGELHDDLPRIRELTRRYADLPLGFADAAVVACAERNGGRVLTLDGDFAVVAREGTIAPAPISV
jgi:predicted nucleic acid-binding protein